MGRTRRALAPNNQEQRRWRAGLYIRLSREDGGSESYSVSNQRALLLEFVEAHAAELVAQEIYVDDGHTGTDSMRPAFLRLLAHVREGRVDCVVVKDLSRLSRNYYEAGYYLEQLFVALNVRFISLSDPALDSFRDPAGAQSILVAVTNVFNDAYAQQTSAKIRAILDMKRRKGEFIGAFPPYGYRKDAADKHRLQVDEEAAWVVRAIFDWFLAGKSKNAIARQLNELGIPCPSAYKRQQGMKYHNPSDRDGSPKFWQPSTVSRILQNPCYAGHMVQGRYRMKSYKVHTQVRTREEEWFVVPNTHVPIIDAAVFARAQELGRRDTRVSSDGDTLYPLSGFVRCADCGKAMSRTKCRERYVYYTCRTYKDQSRTACTRHSISEADLFGAVLAAINVQLAKLDMAHVREAVAACRSAAHMDSLSARSLHANRRQLAQKQTFQTMLWEDWKQGHISQAEYSRMHAQYEQEVERLQSAIAAAERATAVREAEEGPWEQVLQTGQFMHLTRELVAALIGCVYVQEGGGIRIQVRFSRPSAG